MSNSKETLLLIDSNAIVHRSYHAFPPSLRTTEGVQVNAVFGFTKILLEVIKKFDPKYIICAFDSKGKTFRHEFYTDYKAHRKEMDQELADQLPLIDEIVKALNIPSIKLPGYEADDILGTIAHSPEVKDLDVIIVSGDGDLLQLVNGNVSVYMAGTGFIKSQLYKKEEVIGKMGFGPEYVIDFKAIRGDTSDNIPGVKGIGIKGATDLITKFGHLEEIYARIEEVTGANRKKLEVDKDSAYLSKKLATIHTNSPIEFELKSAVLSEFDDEEVKQLFQKFQFRSLLTLIPSAQRAEVVDPQQSFFSDEPVTHMPSDYSSDYEVVESIDRAIEILDQVKSAPLLSFDTETDGLEILTSKAIGVSLSVKEGSAYYLTKVVIENPKVISKLKEVFALPIPKVAHNAKFDMHVFRKLGVEVVGDISDTMVMYHLLDMGSGKLGLKELAFSKLGFVMKELKEVVDIVGGKINMQTLDEGKLGNYSCADADATFRLFQYAKSQLEKEEYSLMRELFEKIERPITRVLFDMESSGVYVDKDYMQDFSKELGERIATMETAIYDSVGHQFNINSPKQLGEILFSELGLTGGKKTKVGGFSTNERILQDLVGQHPIVELILDYRGLAKLKSTYTDNLLTKINPENGRINGTFNQAIASTGRLSSTSPNLQNIPVTTDDGMRIREGFRSPKGRALLGFDIAQQELRVAAILSKEEKLINAFKENIDIHSLTASEIYKVSIDQVTKDQRRVGKTLNFSILYGISEFGLADRLKVDRVEAKLMIEQFWQTYPKIREYFDNLVKDARVKGYAETLYGRRRNAIDLTSSNFHIRSAIEREIINFPIQGTSAELMKKAMIAVDDYLEKVNFKFNSQIVLQIHDELILEIDEAPMDEIKDFSYNIKTAMEQVVDFEIPLKVEAKLGHSWAKLDEISF